MSCCRYTHVASSNHIVVRLNPFRNSLSLETTFRDYSSPSHLSTIRDGLGGFGGVENNIGKCNAENEKREEEREIL